MIIIIRINYTRIQNLSGDVCEAGVVLSSFYGVGWGGGQRGESKQFENYFVFFNKKKTKKCNKGFDFQVKTNKRM